MRSYPVHNSLTVQEGEDFYKTANWWKAVINYQLDDGNGSIETAVYLWHNEDGEWNRKNKYVIKTAEAWEDDKQTLSKLLNDSIEDDSLQLDGPERLPVSDYYSVSHGTTVFKTDEWWKSIVRIDAKGDYETAEVIIYLWQNVDDKWSRRQKYPIKDLDDWDEEAHLISEFIDSADHPQSSVTDEGGDLRTTTSTDRVDTTLEGKLMKVKEEEHVSDQLRS